MEKISDPKIYFGPRMVVYPSGEATPISELLPMEEALQPGAANYVCTRRTKPETAAVEGNNVTLKYSWFVYRVEDGKVIPDDPLTFEVPDSTPGETDEQPVEPSNDYSSLAERAKAQDGQEGLILLIMESRDLDELLEEQW